MGGAELLLLCIAVLYVVECTAVVRSEEVLFERVRGRWRERRDGLALSGVDVRLVLTNPLSFGATHLIASRAPAPGTGSTPLEIRARLGLASDALAPLRADCAAIATFVFVLGPVLVLLTGLTHAWLPMLLGGAVLLTCVVADVRQAHRSLYRGEGAPWSTVLTILVSPAAAMRAHHLFARVLVADCHPLALACAICDAKELRRITAAEIRERGDDPEIVRYLPHVPGGVADLIAAPSDRDASARTYCPRCLGQYVLDSGRCADCQDMALVRFPEVLVSRS